MTSVRSITSRKAHILAIASFLTFLVIAGFVFGGAALPGVDTAVAQSMMQVGDQTPFIRYPFIFVTWCGNWITLGLLMIVGVTTLVIKGQRRLAVAWGLIVISGALMNLVLKDLFDRPRPPLAWRDASVNENNTSFPSGHSMGSAIGYGMLGFVLWRNGLRNWWLVLPWIALVGFSRIFLRAHWLSDVLAGVLIGAAWLALGLALFERKDAVAKSRSS